jgi:hypothetical protein
MKPGCLLQRKNNYRDAIFYEIAQPTCAVLDYDHFVVFLMDLGNGWARVLFGETIGIMLTDNLEEVPE